MTSINCEILKSLISYDEESGVFTWLPRDRAMFESDRSFKVWNTRYSGKRAGGISNGYPSIAIHGVHYYAHRLAWLYHYGTWPSGEIDHQNGDRSDCRINNLRDVSRLVNQQNLRNRFANTAPMPLGVYFNERKVARRYSASIRLNGKSKHLGYFDTPELAHQAYVSAKRIHHEGCTI